MTQSKRLEVAKNLRRARRALDLTQWELADAAKCSQASVVRIEQGRSTSAALLKRIVGTLLRLEGRKR